MVTWCWYMGLECKGLKLRVLLGAECEYGNKGGKQHLNLPKVPVAEPVDLGCEIFGVLKSQRTATAQVVQGGAARICPLAKVHQIL